jgi:TonB-linked SusC/RagA family outer membrane protein
MKTKFSGILTLLLAFVVQFTFAQEKTISGTVSDNAGIPLPGVNIIVKGTTTGTQTDFDGNYSINASVGDVLTFSYVGLITVEQTVGSANTINVSMEEDATALEEVIVTAQGIKREKKALGYAVSSVDAEQLEQRAEGDIARILQGKTSGVEINTTSGVSGSATNIIIRGYSTISGSNQPLFIVDGVPFSGDTNNQGSFTQGGTQSSRFLDLDPNSIANVSVLKGLAATTIYGQEGRNGVILITTKGGSIDSASKKNEITLTQSVFFNELASLPDYQNNYGGGFHQNFGWFFSNWGPHFDTRGQQGIAADGTVPHPFTAFASQSNKDAFPELSAPGTRYEYRPYDSVSRFFRTGVISSTSLNIAGTTDKVSYNVNYGYLDDKGFTPGNTLRRNNFSFGGRAELSNNFTVNATINYSITDYVTPPIASSFGSGSGSVAGSSAFGDVFYTPRNVDLIGLPFQNPANGSSVYYRSGNDIQNPRWTVRNAQDSQKVNRVFGGATLNYKFNDNISVLYRVGIDNFNTINQSYQNKGGVDGAVLGFLQTSSVTNTIWDHTALATFDYKLSDDFNLDVNIGGNSKRTTFNRQGVYSTGQIVFGVVRHFNFTAQSNSSPFTGNIHAETFENILGLYATTTLGYKNFAYLTVSGRNDWASTLETGNNTLFYPSASGSLIMTQAFPSIKDIGLNYLKFRGGYGQSAGFPSPFSTRNTLVLNSQAFIDENGNTISTNSVSDRLGNPNLLPESIEEIELGIESKFWNNRAYLDFSIYKKNTNDLITDRLLDPSTGFDRTRINAGELETKGIEIDFGITPIQTDDFSWDISGNFSAYESTVISLPDGIDQIVFAGFTNLGNTAIAGEAYGVIIGATIARDANGNAIIDSGGDYLVDNTPTIIGDPNPDWSINTTNTISYKGLSFNMNWSYRHGGDIYSTTAGTLIGRGITTDTGNIDRQQTLILPGVTQTGAVNTTQITMTRYYFNNTFASGAEDTQIWDGSTIRLREVSLSYRLSDKMLEKTPFGSVSFTLSGQNLFYEAVNFPKGTNFDTNIAGTGVGNGLGMDFLNGPSSKRYGFSLKATF